jgi:nucleoside phosphorylase
MLTVIAAMEQELTRLRRELKGRRSEPVDMHVIGIGKERAQASIGRILDSRRWHQGDALLMLGFAGALDPVLKCGDLMVPTYYYTESGDHIAADRDLWQQARLAALDGELPVVQGNSLTVSEIIATPDEKGALYRRHQVGSVNMEDYWVAEVATNARVPFLSARAVLDPAGQALPRYVPELAGRPLEAAFRVLSQPWRAPAILALAGLRSKAQASLNRFGLAFINRELSNRGLSARKGPPCAGQ